jgi:hypothetical protein
MSSNSSSESHEVDGAVVKPATKAARKYVPKHAIRLRGNVGVYRKCRGCGEPLVSIGTGRPQEWCGECRRLKVADYNSRYYKANRVRLLKELNEKRFAERQRRGSV